MNLECEMTGPVCGAVEGGEVVGSSGKQEMWLVRWLGQLLESLHVRSGNVTLGGNGKLFDELHINTTSSSPIPVPMPLAR